MNQPENPYAAPVPPVKAGQTAMAMPALSQAYIGVEDNRLVVQRSAQLPPICVKTNQPATHYVDRNYYWHHPAIFLSILAGLLIYVILALVLRKSIKVSIPLSDEAFNKRKRNGRICICLMLLCTAAIIGAIFGLANFAQQSDVFAVVFGPLIPISFVTLLVTAVIYSNISGILRPKKITEQHGWFSGCDAEYLRQISELSWEQQKQQATAQQAQPVIGQNGP